jgi:multidrug resistance efflux pump
VNARNRVFLILGLLTLGSLIWYFATVRTSGDLLLIGTVDANQVLVSSKIPGRIETLTVDEGDQVQAGQLIAVIESQDLAAAQQAAEATASSQKSKLGETLESERETRGDTGSATISAQAVLQGAKATLAQAQANYDHQQADTSRTVALAQQGISSAQAKEDAETSLQAAKAAVDAAHQNVSAAEASLKQIQSHELLVNVAARTVDETRDQAANAQALAQEAKVELGYTKIYAPVSGRVDVRAARQGEVVAAGSTIVTIMDLTQTWVYAPLPETQADSIQLGDMLRVVMPSGAAVQGKVINKAAEADFATQRDINGGPKRDIETVQIKLLIDNPGERFVPGMTADVYIPKSKLVKP